MIIWPAKDPDERLDYGWAVPLDTDDAITSATASVVSGTVTIDGSVTFTGATVKVWIVGGTAAETASIQLRAVTTAGRTFETTASLSINSSVGANLTLALVKQHLEYEEDDRDELIAHLIRASAEHVEGYTGVALSVRTFSQLFPDFQCSFRTDYGPLLSLTSLEYVDLDGADQAVTDARISAGVIKPAYNTVWPLTQGPVTITYVAGYANVPADLIHAQLLMIGHWFANREAVVIGSAANEIPMAAQSLMSRHRRTWLLV